MGVMLGDVRCLTADATKNPYGLIGGPPVARPSRRPTPVRDW